MPLVLLLVMLTACAATPQDLSGKMFTFPQESSTNHVRLTTSRQNLGAVTLCLRFFTDLSRGFSLFSLATPNVFNDFMIYTQASEISLWARDKSADFAGQQRKLNEWQSVCGKWDAASGIGQVWLDGNLSSRKFISSGSNISGPMITVVGQEQDSHGGGFDRDQSFIGMMSDIHMWDYGLSYRELWSYAKNVSFSPGNVFNWKALDFQYTQATNYTKFLIDPVGEDGGLRIYCSVSVQNPLEL